MLQLVILAQLREDADPEPIVAVLEDMPNHVPTIRRSELRRDLGLTKSLGHNATFMWVADFDDQAGWQVYRDSAQHDAFRDLLIPAAEQYLATQTIVRDTTSSPQTTAVSA